METPYLREQLAELALSHAVGDVCLAGGRGAGKSALGLAFARQFGYEVDTLLLHPEMSARDLLQQRATLPNGDTEWRHSPLVRAALEGRLLLLDGLHRLHRATFSALHRFVVDREADLYDGRRLLRHDRFDALCRRHGWTPEELASRGVLRVHPAFRIVALAEPPAASGGGSGGGGLGQWLPSEALTSFLFHALRPMSLAEEQAVVQTAFGSVQPPPQLQALLAFAQTLRGVDAETDTALAPLAKHLSTRQLLRIARRLAQHPGEAEDLGRAVHKACLYRFLPRLTQRALDDALTNAGLASRADPADSPPLTCERANGRLRIGRAEFPLAEVDRHAVKIPDIRFYDNQEQLRLMESILEDFLLGEHILLIGNQGVGKNKIIDRLLQLMRKPREYLQLHRDTTVHSLTVQPGLKDGAIVWEDSPLVRAVQQGHLLVVDEADKAPTQVTCVLKTLVESGEMYLADGRRIVAAASPSADPSDPRQLVAHPDFRMIVLANRPGFPFLGNDFFAALGDLFSCHVVDNPPLDSEVAMLRRYAPNVAEDRLLQLVRLFAELRGLADEGQLAYPYSTRELVSIVRHLEAFPKEGLSSVVRNVFDFDAYSAEAKATLLEVLHRHGVPVGASPDNVQLAAELPMPAWRHVGAWEVAPLRRMTMRLQAAPVALQPRGPVRLERSVETLESRQVRGTHFSEQSAALRLKLDDYSAIGDVAVSSAGLHVLTLNPIALQTVRFDRSGAAGLASSAEVLSLQEIFPPIGTGFRPRFRLAAAAGDAERLLVHEEVTNILLQVQADSGSVWRLLADNDAFPERPLRRRVLWPRAESEAEEAFKMCGSADGGSMAFFANRGAELVLFDFDAGAVHKVESPVKIGALHAVAPDAWLLEEASDGRGGAARFLLSRPDGASDEFRLQSISGEAPDGLLQFLGQQELPPPAAVKAGDTDAACRVAIRPGVALDLLVGEGGALAAAGGALRLLSADLPDGANDAGGPLAPLRSAVAVLPTAGLLVRGVGAGRVPSAAQSAEASAYLEVIDLGRGSMRYLPVSGRSAARPQSSWLRVAAPELFVCATPAEDVLTVDHSGAIRVWQVAPERLKAALSAWREMVGLEGDASRNLMIERDVDFTGQLDDLQPKEGRFDPTGAPHVGGNTWAGGTGGRGTAGLGGVGGPYRLDAGHDVHQVSDAAKEAVPEHVRAAAREVGMKAWRKRLNEIEMSEYDGELYERYLGKVQRQVTALRLLLDNLQAKGKERQWMRHQTEGELDDAKLIEGLVGEKSVYKVSAVLNF